MSPGSLSRPPAVKANGMPFDDLEIDLGDDELDVSHPGGAQLQPIPQIRVPQPQLLEYLIPRPAATPPAPHMQLQPPANLQLTVPQPMIHRCSSCLNIFSGSLKEQDLRGKSYTAEMSPAPSDEFAFASTMTLPYELQRKICGMTCDWSAMKMPWSTLFNPQQQSHSHLGWSSQKNQKPYEKLGTTQMEKASCGKRPPKKSCQT
ncbi:hypothetical protein BKA62DRAFT_779626 [Auriculariales sp. MPI-PUGE-AT-0066]|nr:hypothetical protein BKA62DRAFT_779626 [Auriculariales sp. MPI-PUGE-AT-0066]